MNLFLCGIFFCRKSIFISVSVGTWLLLVLSSFVLLILFKFFPFLKYLHVILNLDYLHRVLFLLKYKKVVVVTAFCIPVRVIMVALFFQRLYSEIFLTIVESRVTVIWSRFDSILYKKRENSERNAAASPFFLSLSGKL